jgi:restriction endonuclease BglII
VDIRHNPESSIAQPRAQFHTGGLEIIHTRFSGLEIEIRELIGSVLSPTETKISREKTRLGRALYAPKELNKLLKAEFRRFGWNAKRVNLTIEIPGLRSDAKPFKEIDFVKERVAAEVQFGKYFSMQYDLQKFQYFYNIGEIDAGVEILPMNRLRKQMSSGVSYYEMLVGDLLRMGRTFPPVPVWIIGIDVEPRSRQSLP